MSEQTTRTGEPSPELLDQLRALLEPYIASPAVAEELLGGLVPLFASVDANAHMRGEAASAGSGQRAPSPAASILDNPTPGNLPEAVRQTVGAASLCWDPKPTGVFDSDCASLVSESLLSWIEDHPDAVRPRHRSEDGPSVPDGVGVYVESGTVDVPGSGAGLGVSLGGLEYGPDSTLLPEPEPEYESP